MLVINKGRQVSEFVKYKNHQPRIAIAVHAQSQMRLEESFQTLGPLLTETSLACRYRS